MLIFFTGFMGVGKTTIGRQVADLLKISFIDLDEEIEKKEQRSIAQLFDEMGEVYFRTVERDVLQNLIKTTRTSTIIALGGGTMCNLSNHILLLQNGVCVYLNKSWDDIESTLPKLENRPKLINTNISVVKKLFTQREPIYALSQLQTLVNASFSAQKLANRLKLLTNR